jgi:AcrR family transcriptional regulator
MSKPASVPNSPREIARGEILKAARDCFSRNGIRVTTMEEIAKAVGVSRQTVYKSFATRLDLINAAVAERISELADDILSRSWDEGALIDTFVRRATAVVDDIRRDDELAILMGEDSPLTLHQALWQPAVHDRGLRDWQPWLRQARKEGLIRSDVTDTDIYEWLQTVLTSLILRPDPDPEHQRTLIEVFLVNSLGPPAQS